MNFKLTNTKLFSIVAHLVIGALATISIFSKMYAALILLVGVISIVKNKNKNEESLLFASYLVGAEVFIRMTGGAILYEIGKYGVAIFLILGLIYNREVKKQSLIYILYIMLLLLGIVFSKTPIEESLRKSIIFNLSGPILLGISAIYFYKYTLRTSKIIEALYFMLLPIFSMVVFLYIRTPDLSEVFFGGVANFYTSGGFGPNQVATILGLGVFILIVFQHLKIKLTGFYLVDICLLFYFIYRGLLTFSRGGMLVAAITILFFIGCMMLYKSLNFNQVLKQIGVAFILLIGVWVYTSNVTNGMLNNRYTGKDALGRQKDFTSGRSTIFAMQLESFYSAPVFGIGVGNGKYKRIESGKQVTAASHNEVSRLLEEHGLIGIIILLILFAIPMAHIYQSNNFQRAFLISFFLFWLLTIGHSAMRIALPSFIYALSLISIKQEEDA